MADALGIAFLLACFIGSWGVAWRTTLKRWPKGWEWIPH